MAKETRILGDTQKPTCVICYWRDDPYDWTGATATFVLEELDGTAITEAGTITAHPTQACTAGTGDDSNFIRCRAHGVKPGNQIVFATSGTLPTGLTAGTVYYATTCHPNEFKVSTTPNGQAVTITAGTGSGTHTFYIIGSVQIAYATADIDSAKPHRLWIVSTVGGKTLTFPSDTDETAFEGITISVKTAGN